MVLVILLAMAWKSSKIMAMVVSFVAVPRMGNCLVKENAMHAVRVLVFALQAAWRVVIILLLLQQDQPVVSRDALRFWMLPGTRRPAPAKVMSSNASILDVT